MNRIDCTAFKCFKTHYQIAIQREHFFRAVDISININFKLLNSDAILYRVGENRSVELKDNPHIGAKSSVAMDMSVNDSNRYTSHMNSGMYNVF